MSTLQLGDAGRRRPEGRLGQKAKGVLRVNSRHRSHAAVCGQSASVRCDGTVNQRRGASARQGLRIDICRDAAGLLGRFCGLVLTTAAAGHNKADAQRHERGAQESLVLERRHVTGGSRVCNVLRKCADLSEGLARS